MYCCWQPDTSTEGYVWIFSITSPEQCQATTLWMTVNVKLALHWTTLGHQMSLLGVNLHCSLLKKWPHEHWAMYIDCSVLLLLLLLLLLLFHVVVVHGSLCINSYRRTTWILHSNNNKSSRKINLYLNCLLLFVWLFMMPTMSEVCSCSSVVVDSQVKLTEQQQNDAIATTTIRSIYCKFDNLFAFI